MTTPRSYNDACAASHGLDLVGERWALLVVRELVLGPKRFTDLRAGLPGISANVLTQRLQELEAAGVLQRRKLPPPVSASVYELTPWGQELEPIIMALGRWAVKSPGLYRGVPMGVDAFVLSLRTMFHPERAAGFHATLSLRLGADGFAARLADGRFEIERGAPERPDVTVTSDPNTFAAVVHGGAPWEDNPAVRVDGDRAVFARFAGLFQRQASGV